MDDLEDAQYRMIRSLARGFARRARFPALIDVDDYEQEGRARAWAETVKRGEPLTLVETYVAARWAMSALEREKAGRWAGELKVQGFDTPKLDRPPGDEPWKADARDALDVLSDDELAAVYSRHWLGRTAAETADALRASVHTINARVARAHAKVRDFLAPSYAGEFGGRRRGPRDWRFYGAYH